MAHQAIIHVVRGGGARTVSRICSQWKYLTRRGHVRLQFSARHGNAIMPYSELEEWARLWAGQHGNYIDGQLVSDGDEDMTSHIVVSFPRFRDFAPPGYDVENDPENRRQAYQDAACRAGREWARSMFGTTLAGTLEHLEFDYVTAFHTDREHPHLHVIVNRRAFDEDRSRGGHPLLWVAPGNELMNYDLMRRELVTVARHHGIDLEATSRANRGLPGRSTSIAQTYIRARERDIRNYFPPADPTAQVPEWAGTEEAGPLTEAETHARAREDILLREHWPENEITNYLNPDDSDDSGSDSSDDSSDSDSSSGKGGNGSNSKAARGARRREPINAGKQAETTGGATGGGMAPQGQQASNAPAQSQFDAATLKDATSPQELQRAYHLAQQQAGIPDEGGPGPATIEARERMLQQMRAAQQAPTSGGGSGSGGGSERQPPGDTIRPIGSVPVLPAPGGPPDQAQTGPVPVAATSGAPPHGDAMRVDNPGHGQSEQSRLNESILSEVAEQQARQRDDARRQREADVLNNDGNGRKRRRGRGGRREVDDGRRNEAETARAAARGARRRQAETDPATLAAHSAIETRAQRSRRENAEREEARRVARARRRGDDIDRVVKTRAQAAQEAANVRPPNATGAFPPQQQLLFTFTVNPPQGGEPIEDVERQGPVTRAQHRRRQEEIAASNQAPAPANASGNQGGGGDARTAGDDATKRKNPRKRDHDSTR
ncbi:type IV secretion system T-DNA border endonuclease MobA/VirD2 domain-containing protein (plasmid) [Rhizobium etli 8C-3]|uniref:Type IV secretion system T-DNA border endonuclease MobA/VirD2 domain-containing protein n=1 Tax=Rhizobium etli 8C-3 TaxID=538025 RepID=A0A1L5PAB8_RHIET|nr:relaxase/mobilization nuclease domain-containing protein [Rhizobium etli]APO77129.1 type IV secretion system T-DNA border endonuclease MobA/VirD2 domain-containing protein [Rhizobium etli 8C-3]